MVVHVVLFRPRPGLDAASARAIAEALASAASTIPAVRRFTVGRELPDAPTYVQQGFPSFPYCGLVEFDDREGLLAYLQHPAHAELGRLFNELLEAALIYDFEAGDARNAPSFVSAGSAKKNW